MLENEHVLNHLVYARRIKARFETEEWTGSPGTYSIFARDVVTEAYVRVFDAPRHGNCD
jgi:hypothetical protein